MLPGIQQLHPRGDEILDIVSHYRHAMNQSGSRYQRIPIGSRIGHMQFGALLSDSGINGQYPFRKCGQYMRVEPKAKYYALCRVTTLNQKYTRFQLKNSNGRYIEA